MAGGYFPRGESVLRRVQGERAVGLLYGQRALLIGALDPRNYIGTARHSRYREQPFGLTRPIAERSDHPAATPRPPMLLPVRALS